MRGGAGVVSIPAWWWISPHSPPSLSLTWSSPELAGIVATILAAKAPSAEYTKRELVLSSCICVAAARDTPAWQCPRTATLLTMSR